MSYTVVHLEAAEFLELIKNCVPWRVKETRIRRGFFEGVYLWSLSGGLHGVYLTSIQTASQPPPPLKDVSWVY